jgi:mannose-6-phosphate isomerase-like protein (cupin superfamily)
MEQSERAKTGKNFTAIDLGPLSGLTKFKFRPPGMNVEAEGKAFLNHLLGLTSAEISVNKMPPGVSMPFYHKHRLNEEIYIFIKGKGEFQIDDKVFPVCEGSVVRVAPDGERCWRNNSEEELYFVVIQARAGTYEGNTAEDGVGVQKRVSWVDKESA